MKNILLVILLFFVQQSFAGQDTEDKDRAQLLSFLHTSLYAMHWLHYLLIGDVEAAKRDLVANETLIIPVLDEHLRLNALSPDDAERISQHLVQLAVMQEELNIEEWKDDEVTYAVLSSMSERYPSLYRFYKCRDWTLPIGTGNSVCEN